MRIRYTSHVLGLEIINLRFIFTVVLHNTAQSLLLLNKRQNKEQDRPMELGAKLKEMRLKKNLTQEELADRCELTKGYISQLENDLTSPSIATLTDLLTALGSNLSDFFHE